jgi:hypothetical protein
MSAMVSHQKRKEKEDVFGLNLNDFDIWGDASGKQLNCQDSLATCTTDTTDTTANTATTESTASTSSTGGDRLTPFFTRSFRKSTKMKLVPSTKSSSTWFDEEDTKRPEKGARDLFSSSEDRRQFRSILKMKSSEDQKKSQRPQSLRNLNSHHKDHDQDGSQKPKSLRRIKSSEPIIDLSEEPQKGRSLRRTKSSEGKKVPQKTQSLRNLNSYHKDHDQDGPQKPKSSRRINGESKPQTRVENDGNSSADGRGVMRSSSMRLRNGSTRRMSAVRECQAEQMKKETSIKDPSVHDAPRQKNEHVLSRSVKRSKSHNEASHRPNNVVGSNEQTVNGNTRSVPDRRGVMRSSSMEYHRESRRNMSLLKAQVEETIEEEIARFYASFHVDLNEPPKKEVSVSQSGVGSESLYEPRQPPKKLERKDDPEDQRKELARTSSLQRRPIPCKPADGLMQSNHNMIKVDRAPPRPSKSADGQMVTLHRA